MERPICSECKKNPCSRGYNKLNDGTKKYYYVKLCSQCCKRKYAGTSTHKKPYRKIVKNVTTCSHCPFVAIDPCQLDVDHINGDHNDNRPENLQVLCANCHRLKTKINKDCE